MSLNIGIHFFEDHLKMSSEVNLCKFTVVVGISWIIEFPKNIIY